MSRRGKVGQVQKSDPPRVKPHKQPVLLSSLFDHLGATKIVSVSQHVPPPMQVKLKSTDPIPTQPNKASDGITIYVNVHLTRQDVVTMRGKEREVPKVKKPTKMKKTILREREERYLSWQRDKAHDSDSGFGMNELSGPEKVVGSPLSVNMEPHLIVPLQQALETNPLPVEEAVPIKRFPPVPNENSNREYCETMLGYSDADDVGILIRS